MRDNIVLVLLGASLTGAAVLEPSYQPGVPQAATFLQEGRSLPQEDSIVQDTLAPAKVQGEFADPGPISHIVDANGTGPPVQDGYPRTPTEIRAILQANQNEFGWRQVQ